MIVITYKGPLYNDKDRVGSFQIKRFIFITICIFDVSLQSENHSYFIHIFVYI